MYELLESGTSPAGMMASPTNTKANVNVEEKRVWGKNRESVKEVWRKCWGKSVSVHECACMSVGGRGC